MRTVRLVTTPEAFKRAFPGFPPPFGDGMLVAQLRVASSGGIAILTQIDELERELQKGGRLIELVDVTTSGARYRLVSPTGKRLTGLRRLPEFVLEGIIANRDRYFPELAAAMRARAMHQAMTAAGDQMTTAPGGCNR